MASTCRNFFHWDSFFLVFLSTDCNEKVKFVDESLTLLKIQVHPTVLYSILQRIESYDRISSISSESLAVRSWKIEKKYLKSFGRVRPPFFLSPVLHRELGLIYSLAQSTGRHLNVFTLHQSCREVLRFFWRRSNATVYVAAKEVCVDHPHGFDGQQLCVPIGRRRKSRFIIKSTPLCMIFCVSLLADLFTKYEQKNIH